MPWMKFHQSNLARDDFPVIINTDTIFKAESSGGGTRLHFSVPGGNGHHSEVVKESFAEVMVMLEVENAND